MELTELTPMQVRVLGALMEKARDMAVDMAVPDALLGIVDEMATDFEIDAHAERLQVAHVLLHHCRHRTGCRRTADSGFSQE